MAEAAPDDIALELPMNDALLNLTQSSSVAVQAGLIVRHQSPAMPLLVAIDLRHEAIQEPAAERIAAESGTAPPSPDGDCSGEGSAHFLDGSHVILLRFVVVADEFDPDLGDAAVSIEFGEHGIGSVAVAGRDDDT